jgi:thiamine-monophosphate kinase
MINAILENQLIGNLTKAFGRSPLQKNRLHESDAELIRLPERPGQLLAVTIDTLEEEIAYGLYTDPIQVGWMAVLINLSDLAAVGASPLGLVISTTFAENSTDEFRHRVMQGIQQACTTANTFVLGGDTNFGKYTSLTGCALGLVDECMAKTRVGSQSGDQLFASGPLGAGNAFALAQFSPVPEACKTAVTFQPRARRQESAIMAKFASACIDSSDGVIAAVDQLMRLNNLGFVIECAWDNILSTSAWHLCQTTQTPPWLMLAGYHGEFELIFTIPAPKVTAFLTAAQQANWRPVHLGHAVPNPVFTLETAGQQVQIDSARIRNLFIEVGGNIQAYLHGMLSLGNAYKLDSLH